MVLLVHLVLLVDLLILVVRLVQLDLVVLEVLVVQVGNLVLMADIDSGMEVQLDVFDGKCC